MTMIVSVCYDDGPAEKLMIASSSSSSELTNVLCALFKIPSHERVVGLATLTGDNGVVIPLSAACRYPNLIFQEDKRLGNVFRLVTKDAGREDEILFPISALTPSPPPGRSHLSPTWASSLPELRVSTTEAVVVPELVRDGCLTPGQGAAVVAMIRAEDPVVFTACRVAGAAAATAAAAAAAGRGGGGGGGNLASVAASSGARGAGNGAESRREWSGEATRSFASMLKIVLRDRERRRVRRAVGLGDGGVYHQGGELEAGEGAGGRDGNGGMWRREGRPFGADDFCGRREGERGEETTCNDSPEVPETFQSDVIALADAALVIGKITKKTYVRALYKAVTLDRRLVLAYHADLEQQQQQGRQDGGDVPQATLRAFTTGERSQAANGTDAAATARSQSSSAILGVGGMEAAATGGGNVGQGGSVTSSGANNIHEDLLAREAELRDDFLRKALSLIEEGSDGFTARHRAVAQRAISVGHPWVCAIYDECKETGDVRGLMQNLQCLPALLERDQAAAFATNISQPPPPGEADSPSWPRHQQQQQQQVSLQSESQPPPQQQQQQEPQHQRQQVRQRSGSRNPPSLSAGVAAKKPDAAALSSVAIEALASGDYAETEVGVGKAAGSADAADSRLGSSGRSADGQTGTPAFDMVVAQLRRVIAGCSQLLVLRGVIGEREERALSVMSSRGSPVLLAAVEAYGTNQDLEDLLHTLQTAAEVELSLTAAIAATATTAATDHKIAASPQRRSMPHQQRPQQQEVHQPSLIATATSAGTASGSIDVSRSVRVHHALNVEGLKEGSTGDGSRSSGDGSRSSGDDDDDSTTIRGDASSVAEDDATLAEEDAATEDVRSSAGPGAQSSGPAAARTAAVGARAQELAAARFAGMRSAAEATSAAVGTPSEREPESSVSPSLGKGSEDEETSGDRRLRQDVSQLVAVMVKQGMLTDRQRLFLLAQVGRRVTKVARERHALYVETGNWKELYTVLMALSTPAQNMAKKRGGGLEDDDEDDEEEEEEEEEGEEESDQEEEKNGWKEGASKKGLGGEAGVERASGGAGSDFGGAISRASLAGVLGRHGASEACDAPES